MAKSHCGFFVTTSCRTIEIDYHRSIREDEIYDWFVRNTEVCGIDRDPLGFAEGLTECARAHANFLSSKDRQGIGNRYLRNLASARWRRFASSTSSSLPVAISRRISSTICVARSRTFSSVTSSRANQPRPSSEISPDGPGSCASCEDADALDAFLNKYFVADVRRRTERFDFAFRELTQWNIQQYRMRYILAKLTQYIEERAWGSPTYAQLDRYTDKSVHVEHILPQTPTAEVREAFDKPAEYDDYLSRLGNLTLLEKTINSSVSNGSYTDKVPGYRQSSFLLTKSLAEKPHVGSQHSAEPGGGRSDSV